MAPRKEKTEKVTADQGTAIIIDYLSTSRVDSGLFHLLILAEKQNRPYSATDISANLHNKVTKTYAAKALKELHESQVIAGKGAGKQWVYHAIQDPNDAMSLEDLAAMDKEITELRENIATAKAKEKLMRANLVSVNATLSTEELRSSVSLLEMEKKDLIARLSALRSGTVKPVLPAEKEAVDKAWREWSRKASSRKKICMELWAVCTEEMEPGKTREDLWEELGLEGDE